MGATIMQQAVKFAARLDRTTQMADMFADGLHGMTAASDALKKVMDEFGMPMQDDPDIEPIATTRPAIPRKPYPMNSSTPRHADA